MGVSILPGVKTGPSEAQGGEKQVTFKHVRNPRIQLRFWQGSVSGYTLTTSADESVVRIRVPAAWSIAVGDEDEVAGGAVTMCLDVSVFEVSNRSRTGPPLTTQLELKHVSAVSTANSKHHINHHRPAAGTGATLRRAAYERRDAPVHLARDRISRAPCLGAPSCAHHRPRRSSARRP